MFPDKLKSLLVDSLSTSTAADGQDRTGAFETVAVDDETLLKVQAANNQLA